MKTTNYWTFEGRLFVANGSRDLSNRKLAGKWDGKGKTVWTKKADLYTFNRKAG